MNVIITGDRNFTDGEIIARTLVHLQTKYEDALTIIHGAARGADQIAHKLCEKLGIPVIAVPANWEEEGPAAGPLRNQRMLDENNPDQVIGFHDNPKESKGTRSCLQEAAKRGITYYLVSNRKVLRGTQIWELMDNWIEAECPECGDTYTAPEWKKLCYKCYTANKAVEAAVEEEGSLEAFASQPSIWDGVNARDEAGGSNPDYAREIEGEQYDGFDGDESHAAPLH